MYTLRLLPSKTKDTVFKLRVCIHPVNVGNIRIAAPVRKFCSQAEDPSQKKVEGRMDAAARLLQQYGSTFLAVQIGVSLASFCLLWLFVGKLTDFPMLLAVSGLPQLAQAQVFSVGNGVAVAYVLHRSLIPVRLPFCMAITPAVAQMNRENSAVFRVVGEFVDRVPVLRYLRDEVWGLMVEKMNEKIRQMSGKQ